MWVIWTHAGGMLLRELLDCGATTSYGGFFVFVTDVMLTVARNNDWHIKLLFFSRRWGFL